MANFLGKFSSFMTNDCKPEHMHGVINREKICIDLNDDADMLNGHLNGFKDDLIAFFHSSPINETKWENARGRFIKEVNALSYDSPHEELNEIANNALPTPLVFSEKEYKVLRQWVESNDNLGLVCGFMGGKIYILGDNQYEVGGGREEARWNAFIDKLQKAGFIAYKGENDHGDPKYELQNSAYEYFGVE